MAEKKGVGHAYNVDFLNVVFAASSLFLLLSVVWMVWDDYDREWKNTQRRFAQLEYQVTQAQLRQAAGAVDKNKEFRATLDMQYMKATYDQDRYDFEATRASDPNSSSVAKKQQVADEEAKKLND